MIVTSDHGEALWEHLEFDVEHFDGTGCVDHGGAPYEELARVPLLTNADWDLKDGVSLVDLAPTLLDVVGIEGPEMSGYPLRRTVPSDRMPIVEGSLNSFEKKAIYRGKYKLIVSKGDDVEAGFQIPEERHEEPDDEEPWSGMRSALPPWPDGNFMTTDVSEVVEERLDTLGYR